jgi:uncharacterized protein (DUF488 family)
MLGSAAVAKSLLSSWGANTVNEQQIWTVGHSNRELTEFLALLLSHDIKTVADVRRFPGSRRQPQFNADVLAAALRDKGIAYEHYPGLGGRRHRRLEDSPNGGWRVESFNAYADYMLSEDFQEALDRCISAARTGRTAMMCAEAVPWRCHRRLIADALVQRGWVVRDIYGENRAKVHRLTDFAHVADGRLTYPAPSAARPAPPHET